EATTVTGNSATGGTGGYGRFGNASNGNAIRGVSTWNQTKLTNTIMAGGNSAKPDATSDAFGPFVSGGFNLIGIGDGSSGFNSSTDQVGTLASPLDPKLGPLQDNGGPTD